MGESISTDIPPERLLRIDAVCLAFEKEWRAGRRPAAEGCLNSVEDEARPELLRELLLVELHYRRKRGEAPAADEYRGRFPGHPDVVAGLFRTFATDATVALAEATNGGAGPPGDRKWPHVPGYEILGVLGRGGMGVVYKARHLKLNRVVALKMILGGEHAGPSQLARFHNEAEANARLRHAHIVQIHDFGDADGLPYLALEHFEGGSLAQKLARDGKLAPRGAAELVRKLAGAADTFHRLRPPIVHRDLKPANVLLDDAGEPKIADFGLAKMLGAEDEQAADGRTVTGSVNGTPAYMAPEQARGDTKGTREPAVDVYALGVILFELLTGRVPFADPNSIALLRKVERERPPSPRSLCRDVPKDLEAVCLKCLEKNPADRYPSAAALAEDLALYLEGKPLKHARRVGPIGRFVKWCRRNPAAAGVAAVAALACAAAGLMLFTERDDSLERVRRTGKFVVGVDPNGAPYSFLAGELTGIDVDLARAIAERLGVTVDYVRLYFDWPAMVNQLDERKIDALITCVSITEERKQQVAFVEYAYDPFVFTVRSDSPPIRTRADLDGKVLVVQQGTAAERIAERLKREGPDFTILAPETMPDTFAAVRGGKGYAVLEHRRIAAYQAGQPGPPLKLLPSDKIDPALADQTLGIALRRDAKELRAAVERVIGEMKSDGSLRAILDKWEPPR